MVRMSLTFKVTKSRPMDSKCPNCAAILSLVPTPSALATSTGPSAPPNWYNPAKAPPPSSASGPWVLAAKPRMRSFSSSIRLKSTPDSR